jgi:hypothetical protein
MGFIVRLIQMRLLKYKMHEFAAWEKLQRYFLAALVFLLFWVG